jgi:glucose-6-phosphate isomerase
LSDADEPAAPVRVRVQLDGDPFSGAARRIAAELADETVASRLADGDPSALPEGHAADPSVWGRSAVGRLGWVDQPRGSRALVGQIEALRSSFTAAGAHRVLLVAGPAVAAGARALAERSGARLTVLDSPDPVQVADALAGELAETVLVVADASGDDPVVAAVHRVVAAALADDLASTDGADDDPAAHATLAGRTVYLTEPGSPLDERGRADGSVVITVDADVPERFSALGPFGLVPAGLAGADVGRILASALAAEPELTDDAPDNPALLLAGALVAARGSVLALRGAEDAPGDAACIAQLVSGAGGPLVVATDDDLVEVVEPVAPDGPGGPDALADVPAVVEVQGHGDGPGVRVTAEPGARTLLWQIAVAVAARRLGTDPYAEAPAVADPGPSEPVVRDGGVEVHANGWLNEVGTVGEALAELVRRAPDGGHLAVAAWLDPESDASVAVLRGLLARRTGLPTTFGWAPRCWPGEGRRHLGDAPHGGSPGVHCHLSGDAPGDKEEPALAELDSLHAAQARSAVAALDERGFPVLRLHLTDRVAGLVTLARAVQDLPRGTRRD